MSKNNWEHYHLDDDNQDSKEFNPSAYSFYDFSDEEVNQMEDDRIASLGNNDSESKKHQIFSASLGKNDSESKKQQSIHSDAEAQKVIQNVEAWQAANDVARRHKNKSKGITEIDGTVGSDFSTV